VVCYSAAGLHNLVHLPYTPGDIDGRYLRHRPDDNRRRRADYNLPNPDSSCFSSFDHIKIVACFMFSSELKYGRRLMDD